MCLEDDTHVCASKNRVTCPFVYPGSIYWVSPSIMSYIVLYARDTGWIRENLCPQRTSLENQ